MSDRSATPVTIELPPAWVEILYARLEASQDASVRNTDPGISSCSFVYGHAHGADPPLKSAFSDLDKDGNGKLSLEEYLGSRGLTDPKVAGRNFKVVDFDRDKALSYEEFAALPGLLPAGQRGTLPDPVAELAEGIGFRVLHLGGRPATIWRPIRLV